MGLSSGLYFLIPRMSLSPVWWPPALTGTCDQQQTDWDGCKLPLELVKWPCLPGRGHFWQLSADGFRGTCLGNEDIWDNFPCDCRLCPSSLWSVSQQPGRHASPGATVMANSCVSTWPMIAASLEEAFHTSLTPYHTDGGSLDFTLLSTAAP